MYALVVRMPFKRLFLLSLATIFAAAPLACSANADDVATDDAELNAACAPVTCNAPAASTPTTTRSFGHFKSRLITVTNRPHHRGRDEIYAVGEPQWIIGKFAYSITDKDLEDEEVDVYVDRGCGGAWEKLGTAKTGDDKGRVPVDGISDASGRVFFQIPADKTLGVGRHHVRLVVAGDATSTDLLIDVVPRGTKIVVSDVDGTLTSSEGAEFPALLEGDLPDARPASAEALSTLDEKGYRVVYLTARPEWLTDRTRDFLSTRGFPLGIVRTTSGLTGATNDAAARFKIDELRRLQSHGLSIAWAFGNKPSDTDAYDAAGIKPVDHRVFLGTSDPHGGRRIDDYGDIVPTLTGAARGCK